MEISFSIPVHTIIRYNQTFDYAKSVHTSNSNFSISQMN